MGEEDIPFDEFKEVLVHHYGKIRAFYFLTKEFDLYDVETKVTVQTDTAIEILCTFKNTYSKTSFIDYIDERLNCQLDEEISFEYIEIDDTCLKLLISMDSEEVIEIC